MELKEEAPIPTTSISIANDGVNKELMMRLPQVWM